MEMVLDALLPLLATGLFAGAGWLMAKLIAYLSAKGEHTKLAAAGLKVAMLADAVVADLNATVKPELQAALADGKLTDEEKKYLKDLALARLKDMLGKHGLSTIQSVIGVWLPSIDTYLSGVIEQSVSAAKVSPQ